MTHMDMLWSMTLVFGRNNALKGSVGLHDIPEMSQRTVSLCHYGGCRDDKVLQLAQSSFESASDLEPPLGHLGSINGEHEIAITEFR